MRKRSAIRTGLMLLGAAALLPWGLGAQSLLGSRGLGLPLEALDARSRARGSVGVGLPGGSLNPTNLAATTDLLIPTLTFTVQPYWGGGSLDDESLRARGTRFPLLGLAYPVVDLDGMVTLTFGSYMDQRWEVVEPDTAVLSGEPTPVTNTFRSEGGVASIQLGWAQRIGSSLSVSLSAGLHTGSVTRTYRRTFDSLAVSEPQILPFSDGGKWQFKGPTGTLGAVWDPSELLRVGASVTWSGELDADPTEDTRGVAASYALPTTFRVGASGALTPRLSLTLGGSYADWSATREGLQPGTVADKVWSLGGGVEWEVTGLGGRTIPLRIGVHRSDLPFPFEDQQPTETVFSGGLGLNLTQAEEFVLAGVDLSMERGRRDAGALKEDFWRGSMTFRVAGW
jgi:hypothetical protein